MGCTTAKIHEPLSQRLREKASEIFKKLDIKGTGTIDKEGTEQFCPILQSQTQKHYLKAVDFDKSGDITEDEWMAFWEIVKENGYSEEEINIELDELMDGKAWVQFKRVDRFLKIDEKRRGSRVKSIVQEEKRRLSIIQPARLQKSKTMQSEGHDMQQEIQQQS
ncbi:unnamed protein product (macronuclear) [Paramecium tetraurelia]|uniref:EF-hand domain-containing protein n=1 Tax=Paramecium tetraurelia TaxID=5888 RepID=A0DKV1_PARTE|nr:uncharacterized protein GSPATT00017984001 [Paramecium tetraurelia]CAK83668.1 unnamed protein product [Paramecium tetraurelia]|eukprot:XP_001451065.1 hypothetical protein (macronuclear) [Paramecium tetraurelia strain d4-2]